MTKREMVVRDFRPLKQTAEACERESLKKMSNVQQIPVLCPIYLAKYKGLPRSYKETYCAKCDKGGTIKSSIRKIPCIKYKEAVRKKFKIKD